MWSLGITEPTKDEGSISPGENQSSNGAVKKGSILLTKAIDLKDTRTSSSTGDLDERRQHFHERIKETHLLVPLVLIQNVPGFFASNRVLFGERCHLFLWGKVCNAFSRSQKELKRSKRRTTGTRHVRTFSRAARGEEVLANLFAM